ncbi:MAG TPA: HisA/HisF-related TIM barrel protein [Gemmataceae bacterium]|nr:HisA/HisF-related TIM barrel protein [Gemmataceae bacterium]
MQVLPVLDLMDGRVVRAVAGRRSEYRPVVSVLTTSCQPIDVARAFRSHFGLSRLYVADLDAIGGACPALRILAELQNDGFQLWLDAGVRGFDSVEQLANEGLEGIVIGMETISGPQVLAQACAVFGERIVFSMDLKEGHPLGATGAWGTADPIMVAGRAVGLGVRRLIVLDLARVGVAGGVGTEEVCGRLAKAHPHVELIAGGGVRGPEDLRRLQECGVQSALVASALHDGRLTRTDWEDL